MQYGYKLVFVNSLWAGDVIWRLGTFSTLGHVIASCLMAHDTTLTYCQLNPKEQNTISVMIQTIFSNCHKNAF